MNVELSSIYLGIWPHYIGNPHTNERDLSAGIDQLPQADFDMPAEPQLAMLSTACNCTPPPGWAKSIFATKGAVGSTWDESIDQSSQRTIKVIRVLMQAGQKTPCQIPPL